MNNLWAIIRDNWEPIVAVCALIVSIYSIRLSYRESKMTRKYQLLSVKPVLQLHITGLSSGSKCKLELRNYGVGPAIIQKVRFKDVKSGLEHFPLAFCTEVLVKFDNETNGFMFEEGMIIGKDNSYGVVELEVGDQVEELIRVFRRFQLSYSWTDLYNSEIWTKQEDFINETQKQFRFYH